MDFELVWKSNSKSITTVLNPAPGPPERQDQRRLHAPHHGRPHRRHAQLLPQATRRARQEELQGAERRVLRVQVSDRKMLRKVLEIVRVSQRFVRMSIMRER